MDCPRSPADSPYIHYDTVRIPTTSSWSNPFYVFRLIEGASSCVEILVYVKEREENCLNWGGRIASFVQNCYRASRQAGKPRKSRYARKWPPRLKLDSLLYGVLGSASRKLLYAWYFFIAFSHCCWSWELCSRMFSQQSALYLLYRWTLEKLLKENNLDKIIKVSDSRWLPDVTSVSKIEKNTSCFYLEQNNISHDIFPTFLNSP